MRVLFMGRKPSAVEALERTVERGVEVVAVVAPGEDEVGYWTPRLRDAARELGIPTVTDEEIYERLVEGRLDEPTFDLGSIDLVISFLFWRKIRPALINLPKVGCVNFHPAPLPDFRGVGGYNIAILEALDSWGCSAHHVTESFDTGDLIEVRRFEIDPSNETAFSLEQRSQRILVQLYADVLETAITEGTLPAVPQGAGRYISKNDFETLRKVRPDDPPAVVERKVRAFWYPPYPGASVEIGGREYTLASAELMREVGERYHG